MKQLPLSPAQSILGALRPHTATIAIGSVGAAVFLCGIPGVHSPLFSVLRWTGLASIACSAIRRKAASFWLILAVVIGAEIGFDFPAFAVGLHVVSDIFLRLVKAIIAPLILSTVVAGVATQRDLKAVGRLGFKAILYFETLSTVALAIGVVAIHITQAGVGFSWQAEQPRQVSSSVPRQAPVDWTGFLVDAIPENLAKSVADGKTLQVLVFAVIFALAVMRMPPSTRAPVVGFAQALAQAMFKFTDIIMLFAPLGAGAAMAYTVGHTGLGSLSNLGRLVATYYAGLISFGALILLPLALAAKVPLLRFVKAVSEPAAIAFATSSSEAALPRAMESMEALGVPKGIVSFVLPAGYTLNLDGAALYLSMALIFVAQAAGMTMTWKQELPMMLVLMVASKGIGGIPRGAIVVLIALLPAFHLPAEPGFLLLGIDVVMDMARTAVNVVGNCLACVVIARWEQRAV